MNIFFIIFFCFAPSPADKGSSAKVMYTVSREREKEICVIWLCAMHARAANGRRTRKLGVAMRVSAIQATLPVYIALRSHYRRVSVRRPSLRRPPERKKRRDERRREEEEGGEKPCAIFFHCHRRDRSSQILDRTIGSWRVAARGSQGAPRDYAGRNREFPTLVEPLFPLSPLPRGCQYRERMTAYMCGSYFS